MDILWGILAWALFGLIVGAVARLLIPGRQHLGLLATSALGIVGSLAGGFVAWVIWGGSPLQASGWILSILGAVIVLAISIKVSEPRVHA